MTQATPKLRREDLYSLEEYARVRGEFRAKVLAHKRNRLVPLGPYAMLCFEDRLTMQYQIQEMLRVERIFEPQGIRDELEAYNPLIPDGANWKATFMLEYPDTEQRRVALTRLRGIEHRVWTRIAGFDGVLAIADEDVERSDETKTSSVHFLRFELTPDMIKAVKRGADVVLGVDHPDYLHQVVLAPAVRAALAADLAD
jgi:hypothetical protein